MSGGSIQEDPRLRLALTKAPVHFLNASSDFQPWHAALRHLVTTVNMQDGLLYSLPYDEVVEHKRAELAANPRVARTNPETPAPNKKDKDPKNKSKSDEKKDGTAGATLGATLDVTPFVAPEDSLPFLGGPNESPKSPVSRRLAPSALMASMKWRIHFLLQQTRSITVAWSAKKAQRRYFIDMLSGIGLNNQWPKASSSGLRA
mgnify:CR=1 FL=1